MLEKLVIHHFKGIQRKRFKGTTSYCMFDKMNMLMHVDLYNVRWTIFKCGKLSQFVDLKFSHYMKMLPNCKFYIYFWHSVKHFCAEYFHYCITWKLSAHEKFRVQWLCLCMCMWVSVNVCVWLCVCVYFCFFREILSMFMCKDECKKVYG